MLLRKHEKKFPNRKRPKPKHMVPYGTVPGDDILNPSRVADRMGYVFITTRSERMRVWRRFRKAARRRAKSEIKSEIET